jgi:hypothetical protein
MVGSLESLRAEAKRKLLIDDPSSAYKDAAVFQPAAPGRATRSKSRAKTEAPNEFSDPAFAALADHVAISLGLRSNEQFDAWNEVLSKHMFE